MRSQLQQQSEPSEVEQLEDEDAKRKAPFVSITKKVKSLSSENKKEQQRIQKKNESHQLVRTLNIISIFLFIMYNSNSTIQFPKKDSSLG